jgi:pyrophosphatase PpaX
MSRPHPVSTVVFDLDGTLVDSLPLVLRAFGHALEPFAPTPKMDIFARLGGPPERIFPALLGGERHLAAAMQRLVAFNRDNHHLIQPFTGVAVVLEQLKVRGVVLGLWTGRDRESTEWLLREHSLADFFSAVVCGDDFATHKPDPQGLRDILRQVNAVAERTLLVGDADVDVFGGSACGIDTVLINHERVVDTAVLAKSWRTVSSPFEAYDLVLRSVGSDK